MGGKEKKLCLGDLSLLKSGSIFNRLKACLIGCGVKTQSWNLNKRIAQDDRAAQRIFAFIVGETHLRKTFIT